MNCNLLAIYSLSQDKKTSLWILWNFRIFEKWPQSCVAIFLLKWLLQKGVICWPYQLNSSRESIYCTEDSIHYLLNSHEYFGKFCSNLLAWFREHILHKILIQTTARLTWNWGRVFILRKITTELWRRYGKKTTFFIAWRWETDLSLNASILHIKGLSW